ncbi:MAG: hypothetical protein H0T89_14820 [Deltaproteobacteria bacterium]|nr:hypothetical protein [Deltaproteobacteria bacterium]MDQ3295470.1 hypothetical protein [Myxococcota bacterium]
MSAGVGADVEALCSKCGDVWHVVVAKVGEKIVKVQCKQCHGYHRYKSPHGAPAEAKLPSNKRPPKEPRASRDPVERFEKPAVAADMSKPARSYRASERFEVGERVEHPSFGQGIVELTEPGKVTVFFGSGRRVLAQAKEATGAGSGAGAGGLTRPKPFDHTIPVPGGKPVGNT